MQCIMNIDHNHKLVSLSYPIFDSLRANFLRIDDNLQSKG